MRKRSRRPHLVSPLAVDFFSYPLRSNRSTAHPIAQVKHPVALDHHVRIRQQVLRVDRPEVALAGPEHDGYDVHAHLVDQTRGKHLATDVASGDLDHAVTRKLLRLGHGCLDAVDEVKRRLGDRDYVNSARLIGPDAPVYPPPAGQPTAESRVSPGVEG